MLLSTEFQTYKKYCADLQSKQKDQRVKFQLRFWPILSEYLRHQPAPQMSSHFNDEAKIFTVVEKCSIRDVFFFLSDRMKQRTFQIVGQLVRKG